MKQSLRQKARLFFYYLNIFIYFPYLLCCMLTDNIKYNGNAQASSTKDKIKIKNRSYKLHAPSNVPLIYDKLLCKKIPKKQTAPENIPFRGSASWQYGRDPPKGILPYLIQLDGQMKTGEGTSSDNQIQNLKDESQVEVRDI